MRTHPASLVLLSFAIVFGTSGCKHYASVSERRPAYQSDSGSGRLIAGALDRPSKDPKVQMGRFIDAAAAAAEVLRRSPDDRQARADYNYAVARVFESLHFSGLQPWKEPVVCPGAGGDWTFSVLTDGKPEHDPSKFRVLPADRYTFRGSLVRERALKDGLGAPMVMRSQGFDPTKLDPFAQGRNVFYGVTEVLHFKGRSVVGAFYDPLATETVKFSGHTFPVAADFTAPIGLALAELKPRKTELQLMFKPEEHASLTRLARFQPYDPKKIPLLCIHGLGDSHATWAPMIESLRNDPVIRKRFQVWFFAYPSGYPYPLTAAVLRRQMDAINAYYPDHKPIVVLGHSMGGMIARTLMTDSGMTIWNAFFDVPPDKLPVSAEARKTVTDAMIFRHRPEIDRVIFLSASHRGAGLATGFLGRLGSRLIGGINLFMDHPDQQKELLKLVKVRSDGQMFKYLPNSVDALDPKGRFVTTLDTIPLVKGIPYHSIIGDRGKGGNLNRTPPVSTDGIVPYWSSHLDGARSEIIIPSGHWSNQHPQGIAEVKRILHEHVGNR